MRLLEAFPGAGLATQLHLLRARAPLPAGVEVHIPFGNAGRFLPDRASRKAASMRAERAFRRALHDADQPVIAWFWPDSPTALVEEASRLGHICVREMINSPLATAAPLLTQAYRARGLEPAHGITEGMIAAESAQLHGCDYVFASNPEVERGLRALGVAEARILPTSFGYCEARFASRHGDTAIAAADQPFRLCSVATLTLRKGTLDLLEAWREADIDGELWLAGAVDQRFEAALAPLLKARGVCHLGHVGDIGAVYSACDTHVLPTYEEGGPQVTYEAARSGLASITTPMGAARLVRDGETGLIVQAGRREGLVAAIRALAGDRDRAAAMGQAARRAVGGFSYARVGAERAARLLSVPPGIR